MVVGCIQAGVTPHIVEAAVSQNNLPGTGAHSALLLLAHNALEHVHLLLPVEGKPPDTFGAHVGVLDVKLVVTAELTGTVTVHLLRSALLHLVTCDSIRVEVRLGHGCLQTATLGFSDVCSAVASIGVRLGLVMTRAEATTVTGHGQTDAAAGYKMTTVATKYKPLFGILPLGLGY